VSNLERGAGGVPQGDHRAAGGLPVTTPSAAEAIDAMWKRIAIASGVLAILFAVLLGQGRRRTSALEAQLRADEAERTRLVEAARSANERVLTLTEERKGDRALIGQLWGLVHAGQPNQPALRPGAGRARTTSARSAAWLPRMGATSIR